MVETVGLRSRLARVRDGHDLRDRHHLAIERESMTPHLQAEIARDFMVANLAASWFCFLLGWSLPSIFFASVGGSIAVLYGVASVWAFIYYSTRDDE
jgi:hypothetical protein